MQFVISDIITFNKKYAKDNHKFLDLRGLEDLEGFPKITVRIHEYDALSEEQESLVKQVEALAFFGVVNIVYVDEEGIENTEYKKAKNTVVGQPRLLDIPISSEVTYSEEYIQSVLDSEEGGCGGGACTI